MSMKEDLVDVGMGSDVPVETEIHLSVEDMKHNFATPLVAKGFMDHGLRYDPNHPCPRFPSSRDWSAPTTKCSRRTCVANYSGKCTMPSLIEIGAKGCKGYKKRKDGKKK